MSLTPFGSLDGHAVHDVRLAADGMAASIVEYGAALRDLVVPLPGGGTLGVVLGFDRLEDYVLHSPHAGAIAGRYANRIGNGRFTLDGVTYDLPRNQAGRHTLHGGGNGFGKRPWTVLAHDAASVTLALFSPDGDAGFPGAMTVTCRYILGAGRLRVELAAFTDRPTVLNLTNHAYFNLDGSLDILDHELQVFANLRTPVDGDLIPDGTLAPISGTPYDFRAPRPILALGDDGEPCHYDTNFMLRRHRTERDSAGSELALAAILSSPKSGLAMEVWTTEPCLQLYDAAKLNIPVPGLGGRMYGAHAGLCLETQHAADSPNLPHLPSTVLRPGELYRQATEFRFRPR